MFDPIAAFWIGLTTCIGSYGIYLLSSDNKSAAKLYVYGKSLNTFKRKSNLWKLFLVPKSFFLHFYVLATLLFLSSLAITIIYYLPNSQVHNYTKTILNETTNAIESVCPKCNDLIRAEDLVQSKSVESISALVFTLIMMLFQTSRRLYESLFISVHSKQSKINLFHYVFGHLFYMGVAASTIGPILWSQTNDKITFTALLDGLITRSRAVLFVLFVYAGLYQQKMHKILGDLRKDKWGVVITEKHFVPSGSLFEFVSCPHFLCEVILYLLIVALQKFENTYWNMIFVLVLTTQTINAINDHRWYKSTYRDYPKHKKAIFPYLL